MNEYTIDIKFLSSESDVEQKIIFPLLNNHEPIGLGYEKAEIQTKVTLKKISIDKGGKSILYFPDYLITVNGMPSIVVEAKKPNEDINEAFRQASLYAAEINRYFPADINPCRYVIASDGLTLAAGTWDNKQPSFQISVEHWNYTEKEFNDFLTIFARSNINQYTSSLKKNIRKNVAFKKPLFLLGGQFIQNKQTKNTFGESISIQYRHLFNPNIEEEKIDIVKNAYVRVHKHDSHVNPIDKLIRKKVLPSTLHSVEIDDNSKPKEITNKLKSAHKYNNQVLLLIGSVGAGKSTFMTYLKEVALDISLVQKLVWITIDLNNAPVTASEIYSWIKKNIVTQIKDKYSEIDFESIDTIQKIYNTSLTTFKKGVLQLLSPGSDKYNEKLVEKIIELQKDEDATLNSIIEVFIHNENKELIIVLDNCDKRSLEEQLLMFEVANWIKESIKTIVFLPLRDTTYDHFRKEKPLDTVIKDLIFRITPASLEKVIYSRIKYATRLSEKSSERHYYLPNNIKVSYPAKDELYYLKSILTSLFQNNFFKRLIIGLSGSDIRNGMEIFLDFCKSGHISESEIFKIKQKKGDYQLPNHIVSKVFLRGNRLYYNDESARIKNLFASDPSDTIPNPFTRISILKWLNEQYRIKGPSGIVGFHMVETLYSHLLSLGHEKKRVEREIQNLLRQKLIISESQDNNNLNQNELICINTAGLIHLDLLVNLDYLNACSEDTWYDLVDTATQIAQNMAGEGQYSHLSIQNVVYHSELLVDYLKEYYEDHFKGYLNYVDENENNVPIDFIRLETLIQNSKIKFKTSNKEIAAGTIINAKIVNVKPYGIIVELENNGQIGLIKAAKIKDKDFELNYVIEDTLKVEIIKFNTTHRKYEVRLLEKI